MPHHRKTNDKNGSYTGKHAYSHVPEHGTGGYRGVVYPILLGESLRYAIGRRHTATSTGRVESLKIVPPMSMCKYPIPEQGAIQEIMNALEPEIAPHPTRKTLVHLERPLLVGLNLRRNGKTIKVFCDCRDIGYNVLRISSPCKLGIKPRMQMELDLFLRDSADAIRLDATVLRIEQCYAEDIVRFVVELEYTTFDSMTQAEICRFIQECIMERPLALLT